MSTNSLNYLNFALDIYCVVICAIMMIPLSINRKHNVDTDKRWLFCMIITCIILSASDAINWISEGTDSFWKLIALPASNYIFYLSGIFAFYFYIKYLMDYFKYENIHKKACWILCRFCTWLFIFFLVLTLVSDYFLPSQLFENSVFFTITKDNVYHRGDLFFISVAIKVVLYIESLILITLIVRKYEKHVIGFYSFIFIPLIAEIIQITHYGIGLTCTGLTLSFFIIFLSSNRQLVENLDDSNKELSLSKKEIKQKEKEIIKIQDRTIISLSNLVENRDVDTGEHVKRTRDYVELLSRACLLDGFYKETINEKFIEYMIKGAPTHDIGKIVISDSILKKPGKLTDLEYDLMKVHTSEGGRIVNEILGDEYDKDYVKIAVEIATYHHEKWNGRGYPTGLQGDEIPLSARIMAVADVFDALVSPRCYKEPMPYEKAFEIIEEGAGKDFDPILVAEFMKYKASVIKINESYKAVNP
ncbi:MAG: HD domain-containing protein [Treponema sp.]|nr:HD domain-containing protein [Candidatus Treponema scatequi]